MWFNSGNAGCTDEAAQEKNAQDTTVATSENFVRDQEFGV
jgi:hypothetical protein